jgi:hypothetical protein
VTVSVSSLQLRLEIGAQDGSRVEERDKGDQGLKRDRQGGGDA